MGTLTVKASSVSVAIVDDHEAVRLGFAGMCENSDLELVGEAATVREIISKINGLECQVVVMDLSLADGSLVTENVSQLVAAGSAVLIYSIADDGGIDLLDEEKKGRIFKVLAQTVSEIKTGKVVIRSVAGESWTVSLFASDPSATSEDVFLRL